MTCAGYHETGICDPHCGGTAEAWDCPGGAAFLEPTPLEREIDEAAAKAIESLARYKFAMFGYWAGIWVHLNRIEGKRRPSPFKALVLAARKIQAEKV